MSGFNIIQQTSAKKCASSLTFVNRSYCHQHQNIIEVLSITLKLRNIARMEQRKSRIFWQILMADLKILVQFRLKIHWPKCSSGSYLPPIKWAGFKKILKQTLLVSAICRNAQIHQIFIYSAQNTSIIWNYAILTGWCWLVLFLKMLKFIKYLYILLKIHQWLEIMPF